MRQARRISVLFVLAALIARADSRNQTFNDFTTPLPLKPGETLILGIVGGWERWDNPVRSIRRTAIHIKRMNLPGIWVETVENHKLPLAERLIREAFDFNRDGTLSPVETAQARVILFGQSLGGRAVLRLARILDGWHVPILLAFLVDSYGRDSYTVPPNVREAANIYQRDNLFVKGAPRITAADPARTRILYNRRVTYRGREHSIDASNDTAVHRFFLGAHTLMEYDPAVWDEVERFVIRAARARD
jgi:pimeloyl-ACP methyl ester carboxylesterase